MNEQSQRDRLQEFSRLCRDRGLPFTSQRRLILQAVLELEDHPTADRIHEVVAARLPNVSRTTVYRTLETLVGLGVITKACHPGSVARYDRRTEPHHHLVCLRCEAMTDLSDAGLDAMPMPDVSRTGFEIIDCRVQLRGVCRLCREKEETR